MRHCIRRFAVAAAFVIAMMSAPMAIVTVATPATSRAACPVGQVEAQNGSGCVPYCPSGSLLDAQSGSCYAAGPLAPPPQPPPPAWNGDITPYFAVCAGIPTPIPFVGIGACI